MSTVQLQAGDIKISLMEAFSVIDEKYGDNKGEILKTLGLSIQTCLFAVYFGITQENTMITYVGLFSSRKLSNRM